MFYDVAVIGAGFAGALLARILAVCGRQVLLLERDVHPRFALGESSTPLAALSLERLAARHAQPDLRSLAAYGRWREDLADLGCGLKRGFTFYRHHPHQPFHNDASNDARYLVAASPSDDIADCQWRRADVDAYLVERARAAGVHYRDRFAVCGVDARPDRLKIHGLHEGRTEVLDAAFVVDGSGGAEVLARAFGIESVASDIPFCSRLVYAHFEGVGPFVEAARHAGARMPSGPYPDEWAAVHHLIDEGWIYSLRFDDGVVSAGALFDDPALRTSEVSPAEIWARTLRRYPTLNTVFASGRALPPGIRATPRLQRRLRRAVGPRWAMLPQTFAFFDPLFSTGIAWSLLGVERLVDVLTGTEIVPSRLERYGELLSAEADQQQALVAAAYAARRDMSIFRELSFLYFACVSFEEIRQRLLDVGDDITEASPAWRGFLGAGDAAWAALFQEAYSRVQNVLAVGSHEARQHFAQWVVDGIRARNLVGLGEASTHLYGVDLDLLVERSARLGLTAPELSRRLPRLRGPEAVKEVE